MTPQSTAAGWHPVQVKKAVSNKSHFHNNARDSYQGWIESKVIKQYT
jgi:hypothetical protein